MHLLIKQLLLYFTLLLLSWNVASAIESTCPSMCSCKWKNGKKTLDCVERGLIAIPDNADSETQVLYLSGNNLQVLTKDAFLRTGLINLQRVHLMNCRIGQVDASSFNGLANLIELDLSRNLLTYVPSESFKNIPLLRDLILSNNPIQKLEPLAFKYVRNLVRLDMSNCELQTIAPKAFEGIEELEFLKLNGNHLTELRLGTIEVLNELHGVELYDNPWQCDCRLRGIKEWLLKNNIPYTQAPICNGGAGMVVHKTFDELSIDDYACKPEILPVVRYVDMIVGENATITCKANAIPPAHIKWFWNGKQLVNESDFAPEQKIFIFEQGLQEKNSILVITNVQESGKKEFYCVAENRAGDAEANFTVQVSMRPLGIISINNSEITGLSAALVILILFILVIIFTLMTRLRRPASVGTKTSIQPAKVSAMNEENQQKSTTSPNKASVEADTCIDEINNLKAVSFTDYPMKPSIVDDIFYPTAYYSRINSINAESPSSKLPKNPDLIIDTTIIDGEATISSHMADQVDRRVSGEYSRNMDSLYPSGLWRSEEDQLDGPAIRYPYRDTNPILAYHQSSTSAIKEDDESRFKTTPSFADYPPDYGLPLHGIDESSTTITPSTDLKTLRICQKGAVPVLPPLTALKTSLMSHNKKSPNAAYTGGGCTEV